jgi:hypothetical protein
MLEYVRVKERFSKKIPAATRVDQHVRVLAAPASVPLFAGYWKL